jgi:DNA segregation ATPase FtsK/SpoIIIE, S-DNA-T family
VRDAFDAAVSHHLRAKAHAHRAGEELQQAGQQSWWPASDVQQLRSLVDSVRILAERVAPGWLSQRWPREIPSTASVLGRSDWVAQPTGVTPVRIGRSLSDVDGGFPVLVPFLGAGHLLVEADDLSGEAQTRLLCGVLLRLAAGIPTGQLHILPVDAASRGLVFTPFKALIDSGVMTPAAPDLIGFRRMLELAEKQTDTAVRQGHADNFHYLVLAVSSFPHLDTRSELVRLAQLAKAGPSGRVHLLLAGYDAASTLSSYRESAPTLENATRVSLTGNTLDVAGPHGETFFGDTGNSLLTVDYEPGPADELIEAISNRIGDRARSASQVGLSTILPEAWWQENSANGLATVMGIEGSTLAQLSFDDQTPHWLVGGPTGSGKTVFLIDLLYGLACRYSPDELSLYLLDFKEGVSFTEFTPRPHEPNCAPDCTVHDPTWIPHARVVGIESDRQYGVAVLRSLTAEMTKRGNDMKHVGAQNLAALRAQKPGVAYPRIVTVIDEFQHLFAGNDPLTSEAVGLLEELARKGRSYGIHLVLASQTAAGIQALYDKKESIFGQFGMRIALRGSRTVLDIDNMDNTNLPLGSMVVNSAAGHKSANRVVRFPDASAIPARLRDIRQRLWSRRSDDAPPAVFVGYAPQTLADDLTYQAATTSTTRPVAMVGRFIDVGLPTAGFPLDATVGRHVAILGTKDDCAHILTAAAISLGPQHTPDSARFVLAPFINPEHATQAQRQLAAHGHQAEVVDLLGFRRIVHRLATDPPATGGQRTYLVGYGFDAINTALDTTDEHGNNTAEQLQHLFRTGPGHGIHILGWWRGYTRFTTTVAGPYGNAYNDVACLLAVNIPASELSSFVGRPQLYWTPADNRAYLIDAGENHTGTIVPYSTRSHT